MKDSSKYYLTDHYSWVKTETGTFICAHETADGLVYSVLSQDKHTLLEGNASYMEFKKNDKLVDSPSAAYIYRIQCPNLWDCIGTNIIRQVIRASQAKNMYRTFSEYVGERVILVADYTNELATYPYGDAAIRFYAREALPRHEWPKEEVSFIQELHKVAGVENMSSSIATLIMVHEIKEVRD